jgi:hypothetical protein
VRLPPGQWLHIGLTYDGGDSTGITFFAGGKAVTSGAADDFTRRLHETTLAKAVARIGSDGSGSFEGGALREVHCYSAELGSHEMRALAARVDAKGKEREQLRFLHLASADSAYLSLAKELDGIEKSLRAIRRRGKTTLVMEERRDRQPEARVLVRGQYDQPGESVGPGVPAVLPSMPLGAPRNRLGMARWLVSPDNPLMARVTVNRFWQQVFGTGLVRTTEDFGATGEPPSHPDLLDWLAVEFRESGWDVKRLFRTMVTSATYRQSAVTTPLKQKKDPENRMLSRGPRFRMDGEMLRDTALAVSGLLTPFIGGPSVNPYQPEGVWEAVAVLFSNTRFYRQDEGDKLYRRSLYTLWKRSAPPASLEIFNAPSRETCTARRERTNTPLQALVTMNDPQFVEAARRLAEQALRAARSFDDRLDRITERVLSRQLGPEERAPITRAYRKFAAEYDADPRSAARLIAVGATAPDRSLAPAELAAWTMLASAIFNLDEALNK